MFSANENVEIVGCMLLVYKPGGGGGGYLGQFLLGMCRWPLRAPTQSILWPIIDPILVTFEEM